MRIEHCPRCGTKRPDAFQWCRKCGLDLVKAERGELPRDMTKYGPQAGQPAPSDPVRVSTPQPPGSSQWPGPPKSIDVRQVNDRQNIARLTLNALDVRCGATAGGCLGSALGFLIGGMAGAAIGGFAPLLTLPLGFVVGMFLGTRIALSLMARD